MRSQSLYSQLNLAPLLDVIFVTLFMVLLSVGNTYRDTSEAEAAQYAETLSELESTAQEQAEELSTLQAQATRSGQSVAQLEDQVEELTTALAQSSEDLQAAQREIAAWEEASTLEEEAFQEALSELQTGLQETQEQLQLAQTDAQLLETTNITLTAQLQRAEARAEEYGEQVEQLETRFQASAAEEAVSALKSEFVDTYIDIYTIEIFRGGSGVSRLRVTNKNNNQEEEVISTREQVYTFLDDELDQFDTDRTLVIFMTTSNSLYEHEQWVESYLRENDFPFGHWRRE